MLLTARVTSPTPGVPSMDTYETTTKFVPIDDEICVRFRAGNAGTGCQNKCVRRESHCGRGYRRQPRTAQEMQRALVLDDLRGERAVARASTARQEDRLVEGEQARIQLSVAKARLASDFAHSKLRLMSDNIGAGNITPGSVDLF